MPTTDPQGSAAARPAARRAADPETRMLSDEELEQAKQEGESRG